ncbi:MAG: hypothetical protein ACXW0H_00780 [Methylobacter sp.]
MQPLFTRSYAGCSFNSRAFAVLGHKEISVLTLARRVIDAGERLVMPARPVRSIQLLRQQALKACLCGEFEDKLQVE